MRWIKIAGALMLTLLVAKFVSTAGKESKRYEINGFSHVNIYENIGKKPVKFVVEGPRCDMCEVILKYRFKGYELSLPFSYKNNSWVLEFPPLRRGSRINYFIEIKKDNMVYRIPPEGDFTLKFKGEVGLLAIVLHVIFMFAHMFFIFMALLTSLLYLKGLDSGKHMYLYLLLGITSIILGGFVIGPYISYKVFDAPWGPFPFGSDVTDTKTLVSFLIWMAFVFVYKLKKASLKTLSYLIIAGTLIDVAIFLIPHSL